MLGELSWKQETDSRLDLAGRDGRPLVVVSQTRGLGGDALEDVVHERVHDRHGLAADASVGVDLFQHLVDVGGVGLLPLAPALLVPRASGRLLAGFLGSFTRWLRWHASNLNLGKKAKFLICIAKKCPRFCKGGAYFEV